MSFDAKTVGAFLVALGVVKYLNIWGLIFETPLSDEPFRNLEATVLMVGGLILWYLPNKN